MKECDFYSAGKAGTAECSACRHYCTIPQGGFGICGARKNINGKLFLLTHSKPCSLHLDPIEKKPLFHYLPGSSTMSIGFFGCNFKCSFCQNYDISTTKGTALESAIAPLREFPPEAFVEAAKKSAAKSIAVTYNEPAISAEYNLEAFRLARKEKPGLGTVYVSNGYETKEQIKALSKPATKLDAINIDLKSFNEKFYFETCGAELEEVLSCIKAFHKAGTWLELTTLLIPGKNNSPDELKQMASFIRGLGKDVPWHISSFFPMHEMLQIPPTKKEEVMEAMEIGREAGLEYVYGGNLPDADLESTVCPKCGARAIERSFYNIRSINLKKGKCSGCGHKIAGIFS